jgi:uncharacterized phage protein (TIGR02216 family)
MTGFPFAEAMRFGFGVLRLSSREFWGLTPRELAAAFEAHASPASHRPPSRGELASLMQAHPDEVRHG